MSRNAASFLETIATTAQAHGRTSLAERLRAADSPAAQALLLCEALDSARTDTEALRATAAEWATRLEDQPPTVVPIELAAFLRRVAEHERTELLRLLEDGSSVPAVILCRFAEATRDDPLAGRSLLEGLAAEPEEGRIALAARLLRVTESHDSRTLRALRSAVLALLEETPRPPSLSPPTVSRPEPLDDDIPRLLADLDVLAQAHPGGTLPPSAEVCRELDERLAVLRQRGERLGAVITPENWTQSNPPSIDRMSIPAQTEIRYFFRPQESCGTVYRVTAFGLRVGSEIVRPATISVSVGPPFDGFFDLTKLPLDGLGEHEQAELARVYQEVRRAALTYEAGRVLKELFIEFHGRLGEAWRTTNPDAAGRFGEQLALVLERNFGLQAFFPNRMSDHPNGWVKPTSNRNIVSGRVRRVVRPGLVDQANTLHVPALVEVD